MSGSVAGQAAAWIVALSADDAVDRACARAGFDAWKRADPQHAAAAARLEGLLGVLPTQPARAALRAAIAPAGGAGSGIGADGIASNPKADHAPPVPQGRHARQSRQVRQVLRISAALAIALPALAAAWLGMQGYGPQALLADLRSGAGEWRRTTLADGSAVTLNSGSAVRLHFDAGQRTVELLQGEILVDVARDPARPFVVRTAEGSIRALGTRFTVRRTNGSGGTELTMLESGTAVLSAGQIAAGNSDAQQVTAGQRVRIGHSAVGTATAIDPGSVDDAWKNHQLVVRNRPLAEVLDELARHRPGMIRYNREQIAAINVSAVLPLDDTGRALHLLLNSFPALRVRTVTPYLVLVDAPAGAPPK